MTGPRVFVLEDEMLIAMLVQDWLIELGYEPVGPAGKVHEALDLVRNQELDAAVLDVTLGHDTCYPVADLLRAKDVPFAFATGRDDEAIPVHLKSTPILRKPYNLHALETMLTKLLAGRTPR